MRSLICIDTVFHHFSSEKVKETVETVDFQVCFSSWQNIVSSFDSSFLELVWSPGACAAGRRRNIWMIKWIWRVPCHVPLISQRKD